MAFVLEKHSGIETWPRKEGRTHRPYSRETINAISYLKSPLGELFLAKLRPPSHRSKDILKAPVVVTKALLPAGHEDKGGVTHIGTVIDARNYFGKLKKLVSKKDQAQADLKDAMFDQILRLSGYKPKSIKAVELRNVLDGSKFFNKGIPMKVGSFFLELFKIEKKHGSRDTIVESAGVYPIIRNVQAPEGFEIGQSDPLEIGAVHALRSLFTGALQYTKDLSHQGGLHPDADRDQNLNSQAIQGGASELFTYLRSHGFERHFALNKPFIKQFDSDLKNSEDAQKCLDAPSRCLTDPNADIITDECSVGEVRFHADSPTFSAKTGELAKITVCVFNLEHTQYKMMDIGTIGNLGPTHIVDLVKAEKPDYKNGWTNISELTSDPTRPVFALSLTENGKTPRGLIDNAGLNGETLVHYDFRVNSDGTVICITHHGHVRQDGGNAAVYSNLQETVLPAVIPKTNPMVMELATLYPVTETPSNAKELLTLLGLSDIAVGEGYDKAGLDEQIKSINGWYNEAFSKQVFDTVSLELQNNANVDAFIASLAAEYPQVGRRQNLYSYKVKDPKVEIPPAADELELLLDNLQTIKIDSTSPEAQKLIKKTASLVRNLLSPNISEAHLFDLVLAARGGVVNCTLPLFDYLRLETAIVKGNRATSPLITEYQKLKSAEDKKAFATKHHDIIALLFADLEVNLLDQTFSRLGLPTAGFFLERAGGASDAVAALGMRFTKEAVPISRHVYVQTSFVAGLGKFISALQKDMPEENLAVSGTDDGHGHGYLCYRANLAKPESKDLFLNMLDINKAIGEYERQKMSVGLLQAETKALRTSLTISEDEKTKGMTLSKIINELSKKSEQLTDKEMKALKQIMTIALQNDLHQTIERTQSLAEMLALYAQQNITP